MRRPQLAAAPRALRLLLITIAMVAVAGGAAPAKAPPACFGAASRDPLKPCDNPALRDSVTPAPDDAVLEPNAPCHPIRSRAQPPVCWFGTSKGAARASIALIGDSHAPAWRAAVAVAAGRERWHGLTVYRSGCPFTTATRAIGRADRTACRRWTRDATRWFARHPEVHTAFVAASAAAIVLPTATRNPREAAIAGFVTAFKGLPPSVTRIVVLRDNLRAQDDTPPCVASAVAHGQAPGDVCALPRGDALIEDPAVVAAQRMASPRVQVVDLTDQMCDDALCHPVVGGALVLKDTNHLSRTFATTLGPFLLEQYLHLPAVPSTAARRATR